MKRRPLVLLLVALLCALALLAAAGSARAAGPVVAHAGGDTWTVALYVNADNDLDYAWPRFTLPALKAIPPSGAVNVVAMVDRVRKTGSWLLKVSGPTVTTVQRYPSERDFGSGETFQWFLGQVHARFPSDHLIVIGWDHGYGWRYFSHDYHSDDKITMPELRAALAGAGIPVDILAFDACNMGDVEVGWDVASVDDASAPGTPLVDYLVGSEETIDQDGYPYGDMFAPLALDPARSPEQVTADMLHGWDTYYRSVRCFDWVSLSAVDLAAVRAGGPDLADFAGRLRAGLAADPARYGAAMREALATSIVAWDSWQVDLAMFADRLIAGHRLDGDPGLLSAAAAVRDDAAGAMTLGVTSGSYARWFEGLTVWAGTGEDWKADRAAYRTQSLFGATAPSGGVDWYRLLRDYNGSGKADPAKPDPRLPRATYGLTDVYFADATHGWATGYDNVKNEAVLLRTADGGRSWQTKRPSQAGAYSVNALTRASGGGLWVAGSEGWDGSLIATSADSGVKWSYRSVPTLEYLLGIDAATKTTGFAAGTGGVLLRTTDAGKTWKAVATAPHGDLFGLDFTSAANGWVLVNDAISTAGSVQRTIDGGVTWTPQVTVPGSLLYSVDSVGQDLWVAGGDPAGGGLLAGQRVSADGVLLHSPDGGATWETQWGGGAADLRLSDVDMLNADVGWAVGDGSAAQKSLILHTADGGRAWSAQDPGAITFDLAAVHAVSAQTAWVVGDGEQILVTTDGGATWRVKRGDVIGPATRVKSAKARRDAAATLTYYVSDSMSATAIVTLRISDGRGHVVRTWKLGAQRCGDVGHTIVYQCTFPRGSYNVKALARDRAGNPQSRALIGKLVVR